MKLTKARDLAAKVNTALLEGIDPWEALGHKPLDASAKDWTLSAVTERCFDARKGELKGDGKAGAGFRPWQFIFSPV